MRSSAGFAFVLCLNLDLGMNLHGTFFVLFVAKCSFSSSPCCMALIYLFITLDNFWNGRQFSIFRSITIRLPLPILVRNQRKYQKVKNLDRSDADRLHLEVEKV